jgi:hypothetical protein
MRSKRSSVAWTLVFSVGGLPFPLTWLFRLKCDIDDSEQRWQIAHDADIFR